MTFFGYRLMRKTFIAYNISYSVTPVMHMFFDGFPEFWSPIWLLRKVELATWLKLVLFD